ncbi:MAG: GTPase domain-containing protein [Oscillospiraceae bacterium]|jgi:predicted GTPase|nr:GTPase domain-containing protein [Oscillospiraceae bacterium]
MTQFTNQESFRQQTEELNKMVSNLDSSDLPTANIIVAGITGTGKSTLLNAVFGSDMAKTGIGRPVTTNIAVYSDPQIPVVIWDTVGLELDSSKTEKSIQDIRKKIAEKASSKDPFDRIHAIWYCVSAPAKRYQGAELDFVRNLHSIGVPFIIVMTQCYSGIDDDDFEKVIREINQSSGIGDIEVIQVLANDKSTPLGAIPAFGLDKLVKTTTEKLPEFIKDGFVAAQRIDVVQKRIRCEAIIIEYVSAAKNGFWDKVPFINIITTDSKINKMFEKIGKMYITYLKAESIEDATKKCAVDFKNNFHGLINPWNSGYVENVLRFLTEMKDKDGFEVEVLRFISPEWVPTDGFASSGGRGLGEVLVSAAVKGLMDTLNIDDDSALMIAFYGYTFVMAIEELWDKFTEEQLKDVNLVITNLVGLINKKLNKVRSGQSGK